jgi:hypothetical protein
VLAALVVAVGAGWLLHTLGFELLRDNQGENSATI